MVTRPGLVHPGSVHAGGNFRSAHPTGFLMRMALTYADAAGAEPDAVKRLDLCMTCWRQAQLLRRWPDYKARA